MCRPIARCTDNFSQNTSEPAPEIRLGCVIMASGLGRRFGSNKLMAQFRGAPMLERVLCATQGLFARRVVVTRHQSVAELCRARGVEVVLHQLPYRSDTVRLGLEAVGDVDGCLFCPGDQPLLQRETVQRLVRAAAGDSTRIWRAAAEGCGGTPVLFPSWTFPALSALPQGKGGGYVIGQHPQCVGLVEVRDPWELKDADEPQTLALLEGYQLKY